MGCEDSCSRGNAVEIQPCDENDTQWSILTIFGIVPFWAQIRLDSDTQSLCLEADILEDIVYLADCNPVSQEQWFSAQNGNFVFGRFEIMPFTEGSCLTQSHEPKEGEDIHTRSCERARMDNTSYWIRYP